MWHLALAALQPAREWEREGEVVVPVHGARSLLDGESILLSRVSVNTTLSSLNDL